MQALSWIGLTFLCCQAFCQPFKKHKSIKANVKKSFLADAMNEMEYGTNETATKKESGNNKNGTVAIKENHHHGNEKKPAEKLTKNKTVKENQFVERIYPSILITDAPEKDQKKGVEKGKELIKTPKLDSQHSSELLKGHKSSKNQDNVNRDTKKQLSVENLAQKSSTSIIASSSSQRHAVSSTISSSPTIFVPFNSNLSSNESDLNYEKKTPQKDIKDAIFLLQTFVEKLMKQNESKGNKTVPSPTPRQSEKKNVLKQAIPISLQPETGQQSTVISGIKYNLAPVYRLRAKHSKDGSDVSSNMSMVNTSNPEQQGKENKQSNKQEDIERMKEEENILRQSLAEKELEIQRLKEQQSSTSDHSPSTQMVNTPNEITNNTTSGNDQKQVASLSNDDVKELKYASLKGVPPELLIKLKALLEERKKKDHKYVSKQQVASRKAFETARKLVKAAFAREQLYKAEQDFFEKVKEMMNKTSTANLVKDNTSVQTDENGNDDGIASIKDYIKSIAEEKVMEAKVRRTSPSPQISNITSTLQPYLNMSTKMNPLVQKGNNSSRGVSLDLQATTAKLMKELNRTKGPEEKNVEAAAHLEEKVAEQQDEMYDKMIQQALGKGGDDEDDDDEDEDEEAVARSMENRVEGEMPRQENYGDFQDSDEDAQSRSEIKGVKESNESEILPTVDENSIFSLRNKISRPPDQLKYKTK